MLKLKKSGFSLKQFSKHLKDTKNGLSLQEVTFETESFMKIGVVGTGYVGLVTGTCFAETGNQVICVDINEEKVNSMRNGQIPIYEPGLETLFLRNIKENRLSFTTSLKEALDQSEIIFLALPTPPMEDGSADLSYILGVAEQIGQLITDYKVIIDKSTVPVGTAVKFIRPFQKMRK